MRGTDGSKSLRDERERCVLAFNTPPDYENAGDSDRDNEYELTVVAADQGGLEGTLDVTVTVTDQNEGPAVTGPTTFSITENQESWWGRATPGETRRIRAWTSRGGA